MSIRSLFPIQLHHNYYKLCYLDYDPALALQEEDEHRSAVAQLLLTHGAGNNKKTKLYDSNVITQTQKRETMVSNSH